MRLIRLSTFLILCNICISTTFCYSHYNKLDRSYRLPKSIKPIRYTLTVEPLLEIDVEEPPFQGYITIEMEILQTTKNITLHAQDLHIYESTISIVDSNGTNILFHNTTADNDRYFYIIHIEDELQKDEKYNITVGKFSGTLNSERSGFYLAKYKNSKDQDSKLAMTQFEPHSARQAFPCFDEPALKAKFIINIIRSESYTSVSNEELATTVDLGNGRFKDTFKETTPMSTYVVAFVVSKYKHTKRIERLRVFEKPEEVDDGKADYILLEASKLLTALEDYTGINYSFTKMDLLGVPDEYFRPGAMENWGLIIFSETHLLYSNTSSTTEDLQRCTTYTAHELAHQWFGNLVTPIWWSFMWLSEGFASYFQYHISDIVEPSWRLAEQYVTDHFQEALRNDDYVHTQPMNYEPQYYGSLPSSWIAYYKACAVIRMAEHFLSRPIFQEGLHIYLRENEYKSAKPIQVYSAFQEAVDKAGVNKFLGNLTVPDILKTWDTNRGYPLVTVIRNYDTGAMTLMQTAYRTDGSTDNSSIWYIPINYIYQLNKNQSFLPTTADFWFINGTVTVDNNFTTEGWLLVNKHQTGYYRVNYDVTNWQRIISFLATKEFKSIPAVNRAQLIDDAFSLAASGKLSYEIPLNLSKYLIEETDLIPINSFLKAVENLNLFLSVTKEYDIFQNYVINLLSGALEYLGFEEKSQDQHTDKLNRKNILKWLCDFGHSECKNIGLQKLKWWKSNGLISVSPDLQEQLFCGAMQIATQDEWNFLYQKYYSTKDTLQKSRYIKSLGCAKETEILKNMFSVICDKNNTISPTDRAAPILTLLQINQKGLEVTHKYLDIYCVDLGTIFKYTVEDEITIRTQLKQTKALNMHTLSNWDDVNNVKQIEDMLFEISKWLLEYSGRSIESHNVV